MGGALAVPLRAGIQQFCVLSLRSLRRLRDPAAEWSIGISGCSPRAVSRGEEATRNQPAYSAKWKSV